MVFYCCKEKIKEKQNEKKKGSGGKLFWREYSARAYDAKTQSANFTFVSFLLKRSSNERQLFTYSWILIGPCFHFRFFVTRIVISLLFFYQFSFFFFKHILSQYKSN